MSVAVSEARQLVRAQRRRTLHALAPTSASERPAADPAGGTSGLDPRNALARLDPQDRALLAGHWRLSAEPSQITGGQGGQAMSTTVAGALPGHHRDPFDRMLVAQARVESLIPVTQDRRFEAYGIPLLAA